MHTHPANGSQSYDHPPNLQLYSNQVLRYLAKLEHTSGFSKSWQLYNIVEAFMLTTKSLQGCEQNEEYRHTSSQLVNRMQHFTYTTTAPYSKEIQARIAGVKCESASILINGIVSGKLPALPYIVGKKGMRVRLKPTNQ
jgi:hypothetical protein